MPKRAFFNATHLFAVAVRARAGLVVIPIVRCLTQVTSVVGLAEIVVGVMLGCVKVVKIPIQSAMHA